MRIQANIHPQKISMHGIQSGKIVHVVSGRVRFGNGIGRGAERGYTESGGSHENTLVAVLALAAALGAGAGGAGAHPTGAHLAHNVLKDVGDAPVALGRCLVIRHVPLVGECLHLLAADFAVGCQVGFGSDEDHGDVAGMVALDAVYLGA